MNKELATKICAYIESSITEKDILKNDLLALKIESLKNYLLGGSFSSAVAKAHIDKLISQCPKFLRRDLYSSFVPKREQDSPFLNAKPNTTPRNMWQPTLPPLGWVGRLA